jgi:hypothetical protein
MSRETVLAAQPEEVGIVPEIHLLKGQVDGPSRSRTCRLRIAPGITRHPELGRKSGTRSPAAKLPIMKSILSAVPAPKENPQSGKDLGRALPIEFVELSRTESYGY